jgi:cytochrome c oxidase assembly protein subunit 15
MANTILNQKIEISSSISAQDRVRRLVWKLAIATFLLMAIGSATRVMNAGLACPDWPLCYGTLVPTAQMNLQVFLEWFHRLDAALIGVGTIMLVGLSWWHHLKLPRWFPWVATFALFLIVFQGILGGLTVTQLLRFDIVTAHLGTALLFFCTLLVMGCAIMPYNSIGTVGRLPWLGLIAAICVYLQSILGGLVASRWALHQCFGSNQLCLVMNSHIAGIVPATVGSLAVVILAWRTSALNPVLRRLATGVGVCLLAQIVIGVATFRLHLQVEPLTVSHQAVGAALLGTLVAFTVLGFRDRKVKYSQA